VFFVFGGIILDCLFFFLFSFCPVWRKFSDSVTCARQGSSITFAYNADKQHNKMVYSQGGVPKETTYYVRNYEKIVAENGTFKEYDYIYTPDGLSAIAIETNGNNAPEYYYINTDYLGSIRAITDVEGNVYARYSYDAWGVQTTTFGTNLTRRGYPPVWRKFSDSVTCARQ
jgi:hypothetical protein